MPWPIETRGPSERSGPSVAWSEMSVSGPRSVRGKMRAVLCVRPNRQCRLKGERKSKTRDTRRQLELFGHVAEHGPQFEPLRGSRHVLAGTKWPRPSREHVGHGAPVPQRIIRARRPGSTSGGTTTGCGSREEERSLLGRDRERQRLAEQVGREDAAHKIRVQRLVVKIFREERRDLSLLVSVVVVVNFMCQR